MKNIFIIGGNSDMALYFVNMAAKNNYKITLSSKNKEKLIENFGEKKDLTLIHLDLTEQLQTEKFIKSLNLPFDDIICFSGKLNQNCFDKKNLIISNYLGIKKFIILYRKKFENLTKFMVITSVAALKIDAKQNIYSFSKKKT